MNSFTVQRAEGMRRAVSQHPHMYALKLAVLCTLSFCAQSLCAQNAVRPDTSELFLLGLDREAESADVTRVLGPPDSVRTYEHPNDVGAPYERLFYRSVIVFMGPDGLKLGIQLIAPGLATRRGLVVGNSVSRALDLYGPPDQRTDRELRWRLATKDPRDRPQLVVALRDNTVASVFIGYVIDGLRLLPNRRLKESRGRKPLGARRHLMEVL